MNDNNIKECQIKYYYQNELISVDELMKQYCACSSMCKEEFYEKNEKYFLWTRRFMYPYETCHIKRHPCKDSLYMPFYNQQMTASNLPVSIPTNHLILGICDMLEIKNFCGDWTPIFIRYRNREEIATHGRNRIVQKKPLELIYNFLSSNHIVQEGINISQISLDDFILMFHYLDFMRYQTIFPKPKCLMPFPGGEVLLERVRKIKTIEQETGERKENIIHRTFSKKKK